MGWQSALEEYTKQGNSEQAEKSESWQIAIGLQQVDGLKPSAYLLEIAKEQIEGKITICEVQNRIKSYYQEHNNRIDIENDTKEADNDFAGRNGQSIADPWYTGDFDITYDDIKQGLDGFLEYLGY